jgi:lipopolysaccharide/colanic/teichoic acid biosynthesis glycosyltransferase
MRAYDPVKRTVDIIGSAVALVVFSPVIAVTALLVRKRLGSPVLFAQERIGRNGTTFTLYKFRSMTDARNSDGTLLSDAERLTAFGALLRSSSLDELPELVNVLRGHMSLVGPRPLPVRYLERYSPEQMRRHDVRPGLTGLAQVNGRNAMDWPTRFAYDLEYLNSRSLTTDLRIILQTVRAVFERDGISQDGHATMTEFSGEQ